MFAAQEIFTKLGTQTPKSMTKDGDSAVMVFSNTIGACSFVNMFFSLVPDAELPKVKGSRLFYGEFECIITKESLNTLCAQLNLCANAFDALPGSTTWQGIVGDTRQGKSTSSTALS